MDDHSLDETLEQVLKIDRVIRQLDESIRIPAFELLTGLYIGKVNGGGYLTRAHQHLQEHNASVLLQGLELFAQHYGNPARPAANVLVLAAWCHLHQQDEALTPRMLRTLATCGGLSIPRRPDCTLRYTSENRKPLFERHEDGWQLTEAGRAHVEQHFSLPIPETGE